MRSMISLSGLLPGMLYSFLTFTFQFNQLPQMSYFLMPERLKLSFFFLLFCYCSMKWVELKMGQLGVLDNPNYKITALLDHSAMITVHSEARGTFDCKPLGLIWAQCPEV